MIEEEAVITRIGKNSIHVEPVRLACSSCSQGCLSGLLKSHRSGCASVVLPSCSVQGFQVGDRVVIGASEDALISGAFRVLLLPLLSILAAAIVGNLVGEWWYPAYRDAFSAGFGISGLLIQILLNRLSSKLSTDKHRIQLLRLAD